MSSVKVQLSCQLKELKIILYRINASLLLNNKNEATPTISIKETQEKNDNNNDERKNVEMVSTPSVAKKINFDVEENEPDEISPSIIESAKFHRRSNIETNTSGKSFFI